MNREEFSIEQALAAYLVVMGMTENDAAAIMSDFKRSPLVRSWTGRWSDPVEAYPLPAIVSLRVSLDYAAVEWIDKNAPSHRARAMFARS
jgi:hypothetical protein